MHIVHDFSWSRASHPYLSPLTVFIFIFRVVIDHVFPVYYPWCTVDRKHVNRYDG